MWDSGPPEKINLLSGHHPLRQQLLNAQATRGVRHRVGRQKKTRRGVLSSTPLTPSHSTPKVQTRPLREYPNIQIVLTTLPNLVALTPAAEWSISGPLHQSQLLTLHRSDLLLFVVLWKYGGVYLDTDLITLEKLRHATAQFCSRL